MAKKKAPQERIGSIEVIAADGQVVDVDPELLDPDLLAACMEITPTESISLKALVKKARKRDG